MISLETLRPRLRQLKALRLTGHPGHAGRRGAQLATWTPWSSWPLLLDDELARREGDSVARRIRAARFEEVC